VSILRTAWSSAAAPGHGLIANLYRQVGLWELISEGSQLTDSKKFERTERCREERPGFLRPLG
jgi:hypothetical protein